MTQQVLDALDVRPGGNGYGGGSVPQIVRAGIRPSDAGGDSLELPIEGGDGVVLPQLICEHQVIRIAPQGPSGEPVLRLPFPLCPQVLEGNLRRLDLPGLATFCGGRYVVPAALLFLPLELLADSDPFGIKVHPIPGQAQAFSLPEAGEQAQRIGRLKRVPLDRVQEQRDPASVRGCISL